MNLKKIKIVSIIGIFLLCFLFHFMYDWFPNGLFAIIFPVNESIWEHMKLFYTATLVFGFVEYYLLYKYNIKYNNFLITLFISSIDSIIVFLVLFLPIYYKIGENMIVTIIIMLISIIISQIISYYLLKCKKDYKYVEYIALVLIITCYIIFGYLTYNPIKNHLFFDTQEEKYGLNNYNI